jgi:hypothetical protein
MTRTSDDWRLELLQGTLDMLIPRTLYWSRRHGHGVGANTATFSVAWAGSGRGSVRVTASEAA